MKKKKTQKNLKITSRSSDIKQNSAVGVVHWWNYSSVWFIEHHQASNLVKLKHTLLAEQPNKSIKRNPVLDHKIISKNKCLSITHIYQKND